MSSKNDETQEIAGRDASARKALSLAARLTLLYTLSAFLILMLVAGYLYWVLRSNFQEIADNFIADEFFEIRALLQEDNGGIRLVTKEVEAEEASRGFARHMVRVTDGTGQTLVESQQMEQVLPREVFPPPASGTSAQLFGTRQLGSDGVPYLIGSAWADFNGHDSNKRLVQIAFDISHQEEIAAVYRKRITLALVLGVLLSAVASLAVVRKGLQPLEEIRAVTRRMTASQLHERIGETRWPAELQSLAATFDNMLERLEDSFARLSQFSSDIAHELRTPIHNLIGETEVALSRSRSPEEYRRLLESNLEECTRLARTVEQLLFLARAEDPRTRIERTLFEARKEIDHVVEFHDAVAQEKGVTIRCEGEAILKADPLLFRRAVSNLLSNSLRYTARGGQISVTLRTSDDAGVEVVVADNGSGIAPQHLPKVFDRLYRADDSRFQKSEGSGLGLAIVKSIMELHGGSVSIESQLEKGTTVVLAFPHGNSQ